MDNQSVLQDAQALVTDLLVNKLSKSIKFHTLQHTQEVVNAAEKLAILHQLSDEDKLAVMLAAWFHDTGYTAGQARDHESVSVQLATEFLNAHNASPELTNKVIGAINATRVPQNPSNLLEEIMCDAHLYHLGTETFKEKSRLLREEIKEFGNEDLSKKEWRQNNIAFLEAHQYFTDYGRKKLQPTKEKHLAELRDKTQGDIKPEKKDIMKPEKKNKDKDNKDKKKELTPEQAALAEKAKKAKEAERGIATVFRVMAQNQNNLSGMADSKANILISVNSIILSIILSTIVPKLDSNPNLKIPVIVLVVVCVSAIVFSILATRPNTNHGKFTEDDVRNKRTNLLFFGNFFRMSLQDYDWAMQEMLGDRDYLYSSIVKDNYFLGVVLAKKYRYLRIAYNIFMYGLILSIIAFALGYAIPVNEVY